MHLMNLPEVNLKAISAEMLWHPSKTFKMNWLQGHLALEHKFRKISIDSGRQCYANLKHFHSILLIDL
jgi:hypothetical protein